MTEINNRIEGKLRMNYVCGACGQDFTDEDVMMAYSSSVECCPNCGSSDFTEEGEGKGGANEQD